MASWKGGTGRPVQGGQAIGRPSSFANIGKPGLTDILSRHKVILQQSCRSETDRLLSDKMVLYLNGIGFDIGLNRPYDLRNCLICCFVYGVMLTLSASTGLNFRGCGRG